MKKSPDTTNQTAAAKAEDIDTARSLARKTGYINSTASNGRPLKYAEAAIPVDMVREMLDSGLGVVTRKDGKDWLSFIIFEQRSGSVEVKARQPRPNKS